MQDSDEKTTALLVKLNKLTSLGQLQWHVEDVPHTIARGTDDYIPVFMTATYKGSRFGLFQQRYQTYDGDHERYYWSDRIVLVILDFDGRVLWETSKYSSALSDLFETVRRKISDIDGILDTLLNDSDGL